MKLSRLVKLLLVLGIVGTSVLTCIEGVWFAARAVSEVAVAEGGPLLNRVAFVGNDGNLWLATPDGEEIRRITRDGEGYRFPTWSPDSRRLAFVGPDEEGNPALYVYDSARREPTVLFDSPGSAPFYVYWSPDSRAVTFLTQEQSGLALRLADATEPGEDRVMGEGAPFYWAWSPQGDQLFMHVGGSRAVSEEAHLSFLENRDGAQRVELKLAPGRFQAPVWSANGQFVFYIAADESGEEAIYKTDVETSLQTLLAPLDSSAFLVLAPDDQHVAYLQLESVERLPALGTVYVIDAEGGDQRKVLEEAVAAMYWSPDGKKLALLAPAPGDEGIATRVRGLAAPLPQLNRFRWWVYDVETEGLELLTSFGPTLDFLQTVPYFDQYHLSLTFWSPDSRYFVVTKGTPGGRDGTVWVLDTAGAKPPRQIGEGTLAVWSWQ
jgi:Tol biopolymer transport system component